MNRAHEGDETRKTAVDLGMTPCVPPKSNRKEPWDYDVELCKQRMKSNDSSGELSFSTKYKPDSKNSISYFVLFF